MNLRRVGFISRKSSAALAVFSGMWISRAFSSDRSQSARAQRRALGLAAVGAWAGAGQSLHAAAAGVCALLLLGGSIPAHAQSVSFAGVGWTQQSPATSPPARLGAAMAYDASAGQLVLFGGFGTSGVLGDTWTWNGQNWTEQSLNTSPPARGYAAMAYDASTGQLVLFGGLGVNQNYLADTWTWNGTNWTQQSPATSPPARYAAAMAYDASAGQLVLFGGFGTSGVLGDTWTWNGQNWTEQSLNTSPPARGYAAMGSDASTGQPVLFGGLDASSGVLGDTWTWNGTNWTQQSPATSPPARYEAALAYDASAGQLVLFGGLEIIGLEGEDLLADTWTWNGTNWTQQSPATSPPARYEAALAYGASAGQLLLFGGEGSSGFLGDTWTLQLGSVNFGSVNIGSSATLTLNYSVNADITFATNPTVVTQGAPSLDFTLSSTTCTGAVTAGNSCTVNVQFGPLAPGVRVGAVQLMDTSGNILVNTFVQGIGQGPAIVFAPSAQSVLTVGSFFDNDWGVAADAAGDVFVADYGNDAVVEFPAGGGPQTTVAATGLNAPKGVAVDGAGDIFIADNGNNRVVEVPAGAVPRPLWVRDYLSRPAWQWMERAMSSSRIRTTAVWWRFRPGAASKPLWERDYLPRPAWQWMEQGMSSSRIPATTGWWRSPPVAAFRPRWGPG